MYSILHAIWVMGFIENNKAECMLSVLINTNLLRAGLQNKIKILLFIISLCLQCIKTKRYFH